MKHSILISMVMACATTTSGFGFSNYGYGDDYFKYGLYDDILENYYGGSNYLGGRSHGSYGNRYNGFDDQNLRSYGGSYGHYDDQNDNEYSKLYSLLSHSAAGYGNGGYHDYFYTGDDDAFNKNWWLNGYGNSQLGLGNNGANKKYSGSSMFLDDQLGNYNDYIFGNLWKKVQPYLSFSDSSSWDTVPTHTSMTLGKGSYSMPANAFKRTYSSFPVLKQSGNGGIFGHSNILQYQNHIPKQESTSFAKKYKKEGKGMTYGGKKIDDFTEKYLQTRKYKQKGKYREYY